VHRERGDDEQEGNWRKLLSQPERRGRSIPPPAIKKSRGEPVQYITREGDVTSSRSSFEGADFMSALVLFAWGKRGLPDYETRSRTFGTGVWTARPIFDH